MWRMERLLRAIAGLAKILAERFKHEGVANSNDEYLAGLWKHEIHLDLSWVVTSLPSEPEDMASRSGGEGPRWNVPTWSRASTPGHISYESEQVRVFWKYTPYATDACQLVEAHCERENAHDEMSAVIQGRLALRGALAQVELLAEVEGTETLGAPHHFQMRITRDQDCAGRVAWDAKAGLKAHLGKD
ncbi:hypothetical protein Neosp_009263 [[Neocosmospora] mangrovei]